MRMVSGVTDKLKKYGLKGETYNGILQYIMNKVDYNEFMERQYKFLEEQFIFLEAQVSHLKIKTDMQHHSAFAISANCWS
jgi:hypothetical protein